jgi:hypothetical protein
LTLHRSVCLAVGAIQNASWYRWLSLLASHGRLTPALCHTLRQTVGLCEHVEMKQSLVADCAKSGCSTGWLPALFWCCM